MKKRKKKFDFYGAILMFFYVGSIFYGGVLAPFDFRLSIVCVAVNAVIVALMINNKKKDRDKSLNKIKDDIELILYDNGITKEQTEKIDDIIKTIKENW